MQYNCALIKVNWLAACITLRVIGAAVLYWSPASVADLDPNPDPDLHVFWPPGSGSGSISQRYGSGAGSGSFYHQAKSVRKTLIPTAL